VTLAVLALCTPGLCQVENSFAGDSFDCPDDEPGFFPHDFSCDKYWHCEQRVSELKTCGNGLAFDDTDPQYVRENCDYLHNVDCGVNRTELEPPKSAPNCPRLYGIFPDENDCATFWSCWNGDANRYKCPPGLAYDRKQRVCVWADKVFECKAEQKEGQFECPAEQTNGFGTYALYPHPEDCRMYYVCMNGAPREYGCPLGTVFRLGELEGAGQCWDPAEVPDCEDYYSGVDIKALRAQGF